MSRTTSKHRKHTAHIEFERRAVNDTRFPVTISTDAPVVRRDYDGEYEEILSHDKGSIDLSRAPLPLIESHDRSRVNIGVVENLRIERDGSRKKLRGDLVLGQQARAQELAADIAAGIVSNISVGYTIEEVETVETKGKRQIVATRWIPFEVSIVSVPADANAGINRYMRHQAMLKMGKNNRTRTGTRAAAIDAIERVGAEHSIDREIGDSEIDDGSALPALAVRSDRAAVHVERQRVATILNLCSRAALGDDFARSLIDSGISMRAAREAIIDAMAEHQQRTQPNTFARHGLEVGGFRVSAGEDYSSPEFRSRAMGEALFVRMNPDHRPCEAAQRYVGLSLVDLARECLHAANVSTRMLSPSKIIERALGGHHGTSDFSLVLGDAVNRELLRAFETAEPGVLRAGRKVSARDFRALRRIKVDTSLALKKVNEHGEFTRGTINEAQESFSLQTYGRVFGITRQALVNDDLGAFQDLPRRMGIEARELESQTVVDLLVSGAGAGPVMADGKRMFHADHGNLAAAGAVLSVESLGTARAAMRLQTGLSGRVINIVPRYLIVPASLETTAEKLLTEIAATKAEDVNPFGGGKLELIVDARLDAASDTRWYVAADTGRFDGLEYAHLDGNDGPVVDTRVGFDIDGEEFKVRLDFGCGFVEHRSWYANPGATPESP